MIEAAFAEDSKQQRELQRKTAAQVGSIQTVQPKSILLVEDNDLNRQMMNVMLSRQGHIVTTASNGMEALEAAKNKRFDIIFMDIQMPPPGAVVAVPLGERVVAGETVLARRAAPRAAGS